MYTAEISDTHQPDIQQYFNVGWRSPTLHPTPHHLHCPSMDTLQGLNVLLVMRGSKPTTVLEIGPQIVPELFQRIRALTVPSLLPY